MNVPNALTLLRIFFVPVLVAALVQEHLSVSIFGWTVHNNMLALGAFLAAALTDLLDGYLARRWGQITTVGTLLDPIADKLLISSALIALVQVHLVPAWIVILLIGREFAVSGLRSIAASAGYIITASDLGKSKMVAQVLAIMLLMVSVDHPPLANVANICLWGVVFFSLASAFDYFRKFWRKVDDQVKQRRRRELLLLEQQRQRELRGGLSPKPFKAL